MCKVTHCVQSYTLCVKLHTEYKSSFTLIVEKFPSLETFYTHAVGDVADKYEVCVPSKDSKNKMDEKYTQGIEHPLIGWSHPPLQ